MKNQKVTLQDLVNHLKSNNRIHKEFNIAHFNLNSNFDKNQKIPNCGTAGCAIGEMPALDSDFTFNSFNSLVYMGKGISVYEICEYFEISLEVAYSLFYPDSLMFPNLHKFIALTYNATVEDVIFNIEQYLKSTKK